MGRDEAAAAVGVGRALAIYHLDKLVESGLLAATYRRPAGRNGPGAGRPAKLYTRSQREFAVTVPARHYELAARLLASAVESLTSGGGSRAALLECRAADRFRAWRVPDVAKTGTGQPGHQAAGGLEGALRGQGYQPERDSDGVIRLQNCPFHQLAEQHRDLVCGMNLGLIQGIVAGLGLTGIRPTLDPQPAAMQRRDRGRPVMTQTEPASCP